MPELPEVENLRRGLEKAILGQRIIKVEINKPKLVSGKGSIRVISKKKASEFIEGLVGEKFISIERRAKNLIFKLSHEKIILVHLKMTGQFVYTNKKSGKKIIGGHPIEVSETEIPNKHTHIVFRLSTGTLYYNDTRMFGYLLYYPDAKSFEKENHFGALGKEPLDKNFTEKYFLDSLKTKKGMIKTILMGQEIVTGVGNIYTDESLFEARIDPRRSATTLSPSEIKKLRMAIVSIIRKAIKAGGSSVSSYRLLDKSRGNYAHQHKVYGKFGKKCIRCNNPLKKIAIQNRTTIFCSKCQK